MNRRLIKGIALFLLLWATLDLCVPGFCRTDGITLPQVPSHHGVMWEKTSAAHPDPAAYEDDCFCCCSHIIHRTYLILGMTSLIMFVYLPHVLQQHDSVDAPPFHPPRL